MACSFLKATCFSPSSPAAIPNNWPQENLTGCFKAMLFLLKTGALLSAPMIKSSSVYWNLLSLKRRQKRELPNMALPFLPLPAQIITSRKQETKKEKMDQWRQRLVRYEEDILWWFTDASKKGSASPANRHLSCKAFKTCLFLRASSLNITLKLYHQRCYKYSKPVTCPQRLVTYYLYWSHICREKAKCQ